MNRFGTQLKKKTDMPAQDGFENREGRRRQKGRMKWIVPLAAGIVMGLAASGTAYADAGIAASAFNSAMSLSANTAYMDQLTYSADQNFYSFPVSEAGNISFSFEHDAVNTTAVCWRVYFYNEKGEEFFHCGFTGKTKDTLTTSQIGVAKGLCYVRVTAGDAYTDTPYTMRLNFEKSSDWEKEFNDSFAMATEIQLGQTVNGSIMHADDQDYYRFVVPKNGNIVLSMEHNMLEDSKKYWDIFLYDEQKNRKIGYALRGNSVTSVQTDPMEVKAGTYYLRLCADEAFTTGTYSIRIDTDMDALNITSQTAVGTIVHFGSYEQDNNTDNGPEKIEWIVLANDGKHSLLLSRECLTGMAFHNRKQTASWKNSNIRTWLNAAFLYEAFSLDEYSRIETTYHGTDADMLFLLSTDEVRRYVSGTEYMAAGSTASAVDGGVYVSSQNGCSAWWLRDPGTTDGTAVGVFTDGSILTDGVDVRSIDGAVRPALWITNK